MDAMIGLRIKERRKELKITGAQIKEKTGISTGNLSDIENGKSLPSATAIIQLSQILECSTDYILLGEIRKSEHEQNSNIRDDILLEQFNALSEDDQEEIMTMVQLKYNRIQKAREQKSSLFYEKNTADEIA